MLLHKKTPKKPTFGCFTSIPASKYWCFSFLPKRNTGNETVSHILFSLCLIPMWTFRYGRLLKHMTLLTAAGAVVRKCMTGVVKGCVISQTPWGINTFYSLHRCCSEFLLLFVNMSSRYLYPGHMNIFSRMMCGKCVAKENVNVQKQSGVKTTCCSLVEQHSPFNVE